jgi:hypothetical protein
MYDARRKAMPTLWITGKAGGPINFIETPDTLLQATENC